MALASHDAEPKPLVEVKAVYRIDLHPAKDHSSLEKHTGERRVRNVIKLLRLPA